MALPKERYGGKRQANTSENRPFQIGSTFRANPRTIKSGSKTQPGNNRESSRARFVARPCYRAGFGRVLTPFVAFLTITLVIVFKIGKHYPLKINHVTLEIEAYASNKNITHDVASPGDLLVVDDSVRPER
jgi:hypothetical protein